MRFDTRIELMELTTLEDNQGGYEELLTNTGTYYAHISELNMEVSEKLFGKVSTTALQCIINNVLELKNNGSTFFNINGRKYDLIKSKVFRNKTHIYLEIMENE